MDKKSISVQYFKELPDGSAIVMFDMDEETKQFFIGEGILAVLKRSVASSESYIKPEYLEDTEEEK